MNLDISRASVAHPNVGSGPLPYHAAPTVLESDSTDSSWLTVGVQVGRTAAGAFAGSTLALATPLALGVAAVGSAAKTLVSGVQLALAGTRFGYAYSHGEDVLQALYCSFMKVGIDAAACTASTLGAGVSALALPLTLPGAALAGAWLGSPLSGFGESWGADFGFGFVNKSSKRKAMKGYAQAYPAKAVPAQTPVQMLPAKAPAPAAAKFDRPVASPAKL